MGTLQNITQGPQTPASAPQFSTPTAMELLQGLLAKFGQQSIAPRQQAPGAQPTQNGLQSTELSPQQQGSGGALDWLANKTGNYIFGQPSDMIGPRTADTWNPEASLGSNVMNSALPSIGSALMALF